MGASAQSARQGAELDPVAQLSLDCRGKSVHLFEPDRHGLPRGARPARSDAFDQLVRGNDVPAVHGEKGFVSPAAEGVDVAREQSATGSRFAANQDRHRGELGIEGPHPFGGGEVGEPAPKTFSEQVPAAAGGERRRAMVPETVAESSAQFDRGDRVVEVASIQGVEEASGSGFLAHRYEQQPGAVAKVRREAMGELEFLFEIAAETQHDAIGRVRPGKDRIQGSAHYGTVSGRHEAGQCVTVMGVTMDDPESRHGSHSVGSFSKWLGSQGASATRTRPRAPSASPVPTPRPRPDGCRKWTKGS